MNPSLSSKTSSPAADSKRESSTLVGRGTSYPSRVIPIGIAMSKLDCTASSRTVVHSRIRICFCMGERLGNTRGFRCKPIHIAIVMSEPPEIQPAGPGQLCVLCRAKKRIQYTCRPLMVQLILSPGFINHACTEFIQVWARSRRERRSVSLAAGKNVVPIAMINAVFATSPGHVLDVWSSGSQSPWYILRKLGTCSMR